MAPHRVWWVLGHILLKPCNTSPGCSLSKKKKSISLIITADFADQGGHIERHMTIISFWSNLHLTWGFRPYFMA